MAHWTRFVSISILDFVQLIMSDSGPSESFHPLSLQTGFDTLPNGTLIIDTSQLNSSIVQAKCIAQSSPDQVISKRIKISIIGKNLRESWRRNWRGIPWFRLSHAPNYRTCWVCSKFLFSSGIFLSNFALLFFPFLWFEAMSQYFVQYPWCGSVLVLLFEVSVPISVIPIGSRSQWGHFSS